MKHTLKHIIAMMLTLAIALTGISLDGTVTVNAATVYDQFKDNGTITMKPGDTKRFILTGKDGSDYVPKCKWTSSDKSIVKVNTDFVDESVDFTEYVEITALKAGTAIITGAIKGYDDTSVTMTVTVETPKATAKQKACRHSFKTTKKATCERTGIKTCKKCRFQKTTKTVAHKYINQKTVGTIWDTFNWYMLCIQCDAEYDGVTPDMYGATYGGVIPHRRIGDNSSLPPDMYDAAYAGVILPDRSGDDLPTITRAIEDVFIIEFKCIGDPATVLIPDNFVPGKPIQEKDGIMRATLAPDEPKTIQDGNGMMMLHFIETGFKHHNWTDCVKFCSGHEANITKKVCTYCGKEKP